MQRKRKSGRKGKKMSCALQGEKERKKGWES